MKTVRARTPARTPAVNEAAQRLFAQANEAARAGRLQDAEAACRDAVRAAPGHVDALLLLGAIEAQAGRLAEAREHVGKAARLRPELPLAHFALGNILRQLGRQDEAASAYRTAARLAPQLAAAHYNLGNCLRDLGRDEASVAAYRRAIEAAPDDAQAFNNLGAALLDLGRTEDALAACEQAARLSPQDPSARFNLANALRAAGRSDDAVAAYRGALDLRPGYAEALLNLGNLLFELNRIDEARAAYAEAVARQPANAEARLNLAEALQASGAADGALEAAHQALELDPQSARGWFILSDLKRFTRGDPDLERMEALLAAQRPGRQARAAGVNLEFALGKAWMDAGDPQRAFSHLEAANRLKRRDLAYDVAADVGWLARMGEADWAELLRRFKGAGSASELPIFVVGMPRSGTSLAEQILASHPQVHGAGELKDLEAVICEAAGAADVRDIAPARLAGFSAEQLTAIGEAYVERVARLAPGKARVVDKMPANFALAGMIALALPGARIVHCRRDPIDTCLSCYAKNFAQGQLFAYDLRELGLYYRAYERLMATWRAVLPPDRFLELDYEAVVQDLEGQARRLVGFCGLAWDDACLRFHETRRTVRTASVNQVRQPIYASSVGRWKPYESRLGPLIAALGDVAPTS